MQRSWPTPERTTWTDRVQASCLKTKPQAFEHQQDDERRPKKPIQINNLPNTGFLATEKKKSLVTYLTKRKHKADLLRES